MDSAQRSYLEAWWLLALALFLAADLVYLGSEWAKPAFSIL